MTYFHVPNAGEHDRRRSTACPKLDESMPYVSSVVLLSGAIRIGFTSNAPEALSRAVSIGLPDGKPTEKSPMDGMNGR